MDITEYRKKLQAEVAGAPMDHTEESEAMVALANDEQEIGKLIAVIGDPEASVDDKVAAIDQLNVVSVFSPILPTRMPDYVNALRGQLMSDEQNLRLRAFGTLAAMNDDVAQERLLAELEADDKQEDQKLVPTGMAICMLGLDEKTLSARLLRKIAANPPDEDSLVQAVRHMPVDPESVDFLRELMEDERKPIQARSLVPQKINNADAEGFLKSAKQLLETKGAKDDMAPYLTRGIAGVTEPSVQAQVQETKDVIRKMMGDSPESFQNLAKQLLFDEGKSAKK